MMIEGPTITDRYEEMTPAVLSIAQLLKFNSIKHGRKEFTIEAVSVCYNAGLETPVPTYVQRTDVTYMVIHERRNW